MAATTEVDRVVRAALDPSGLEVVDVEVTGSLVRVVLDHPGGVDLDALARASNAISEALDAQGAHAPSSGAYTLEVSSPGLERSLRTPEHFRRHVGAVVAIKTRPGVPGERRCRGRLVAADDSGISVSAEGGEPGQGVRRLDYGDLERARTVFEWGPADAGRSRANLAKKKEPSKKKATTKS